MSELLCKTCIDEHFTECQAKLAIDDLRFGLQMTFQNDHATVNALLQESANVGEWATERGCLYYPQKPNIQE